MDGQVISEFKTASGKAIKIKAESLSSGEKLLSQIETEERCKIEGEVSSGLTQDVDSMSCSQRQVDMTGFKKKCESGPEDGTLGKKRRLE